MRASTPKHSFRQRKKGTELFQSCSITQLKQRDRTEGGRGAPNAFPGIRARVPRGGRRQPPRTNARLLASCEQHLSHPHFNRCLMSLIITCFLSREIPLIYSITSRNLFGGSRIWSWDSLPGWARTKTFACLGPMDRPARLGPLRIHSGWTRLSSLLSLDPPEFLWSLVKLFSPNGAWITSRTRGFAGAHDPLDT